MGILSTARWLLPCLALVACVPEFTDDSSLVSSRRIIAVQGTPAEAPERADVSLRVVVAASGEAGGTGADVVWTLCLDRKPLTELGPVSSRCLTSPELDPEIGLSLGRGPEVTATLPELACQLFGPERPNPKPGQPAARPVDPDPTGGFYQPVIAWLDGIPVLGAVRLACPLVGVTPANTTAFNSRYRANENPTVERFELVTSSGEVQALSPDGDAPSVAPGASVTLRVTSPVCPVEPVCDDGICSSGETTSTDFPDLVSCPGDGTHPADCDEPKGCGGKETYVVYDRERQRLLTRTESLVVSWYATAGKLTSERTEAPAGADGAPSSTNRWTAPDAPGTVRIWAVIRDERGGSSAAEAVFSVQN